MALRLFVFLREFGFVVCLCKKGIFMSVDMTLWNKIYGNETLKKTLLSDIEGNVLGHAFIIEGPEGSGKLTIARTVVATLANCPERTEQILNGICTDVSETDVPEGKKQIGVDAVRQIRTSSVIKAGDLDIKAYIIKNSDKMTDQAQNALLKILEEPTSGVYFFLLTTNAHALLPTVRSRAPVVRTEVFNCESLKRYALSALPAAAQLEKRDPEAFDRLLHRASGTVGGLISELESVSGGTVDSQTLVADLLKTLKASDRIALTALVDSTCQSREETVKFVTTVRYILRDTMVVKSRADADTMVAEKKDVEELAKRSSVAKILSLDQKFESLALDLDYNPNISNVKLSVLRLLWENLR